MANIWRWYALGVTYNVWHYDNGDRYTDMVILLYTQITYSTLSCSMDRFTMNIVFVLCCVSLGKSKTISYV